MPYFFRHFTLNYFMLNYINRVKIRSRYNASYHLLDVSDSKLLLLIRMSYAQFKPQITLHYNINYMSLMSENRICKRFMHMNKQFNELTKDLNVCSNR